MAIEEQLPGGAGKRRTARAVLTTPISGEYSLRLYRQTIITKESGAVFAGGEERPISRRAADLASLTVEVGGQQVTGEFIMEALAAAFDAIDADEQARLAPPEEPDEEEPPPA